MMMMLQIIIIDTMRKEAELGTKTTCLSQIPRRDGVNRVKTTRISVISTSAIIIIIIVINSRNTGSSIRAIKSRDCRR